MEKKSIGSFIAILRKSQGMTQRELAERLCVSDKAVSRWERDEAAPDLTLIPVIADIFGVTCDEILRGEKLQKTDDTAPIQKKGSEKQLRHLIGMNLNKFKKQLWIVFGLAAAGVVLCLILYLSGYPTAGLGTGLVLSIAAAVVLGVYTTAALFPGDTDELDEESVVSYKKSVYSKAFHGAMFITASICADAVFWLLGEFGTLLCLIPVLVFLFIRLCAAAVFSKKLSKELNLSKKDRHNSALAFKTFVVFLLVAAVLTAGIVTAYNLPYTCFSKGTTFETAEEFKTYMRNHNFEDVLWISEDEEDRNVPEGYDKRLLTTDDTDEFDCVRYKEYEVDANGEENGFWFFENDSVERIDGSSESLPITVFSDEDYQRRGKILTVLNNLMIVFCVLDAAAAIAFYLKKRQK